MTRSEPGGEDGAGTRWQNSTIGADRRRRVADDIATISRSAMASVTPGSRRASGAVFCPEQVNLPRRCVAMTTDSAGEPAPPAGAAQASGVRKLGRWLTRWWFQARDGRTYQRRGADALAGAVGLGVVVACGVLVANRLLVGTKVSVFRRINHWPGWPYPPMHLGAHFPLDVIAGGVWAYSSGARLTS